MCLNVDGILLEIVIEVSGYVVLKENYFLDDGVYFIVKILMIYVILWKNGKDLLDLIVDLRELVESEEICLSIIVIDFKVYGKEVLVDFLIFVEVDLDMELEFVN